jgi:ribonuclease BN (tRNA processing enzyme)
VFTGDTGPSDKVAELAQNADILVSEVGSADDVKQLLTKNGTWQNMSAEQQIDVMRHLTDEHLTPAEVGKLAARAKAGKVVLTHLLPSVNDNDDYARIYPRSETILLW